MVQTTTSYEQRPAQTVRISENERDIPVLITCAICGAGYGPSLAHKDLLQVSPTLLEAVFMSVCHFCFRCRRPACPACWDTVHGVCGACVQEANLPFRAETTPLRGLIFPPLREKINPQENTSSQFLICVHPGSFQADVTHRKALPVVAASTHYQLQEEIEQRSTTTGHDIVQVSQVQDDDVYEPQRPPMDRPFIKLVERIFTIILLIVLLAIVVMIVLAEVSGTGNTVIVRLLHVDIRSEVGYLFSLVSQLHY